MSPHLYLTENEILWFTSSQSTVRMYLLTIYSSLCLTSPVLTVQLLFTHPPTRNKAQVIPECGFMHGTKLM